MLSPSRCLFGAPAADAPDPSSAASEPVPTARRWRVPAWAGSPFWLAALLALGGLLLYPTVHDLVLGVAVTPAERGFNVALKSGCFNCHGLDGAGGVKNPGREDGEVPSFSGGTPMMWVKNEQELREYILDGAPARKRASAKYREQQEHQLMAMPAYRGHLSASELEDLIVYLRAVSGLITPTDPVAAKGLELAFRFSCFRCHGPMGGGSLPNPGSLKGYIPGWWGSDYRELVRSDEELRDWILSGGIKRLRDSRIAQYFIHRQRVYMPAYRDFITDQELDAVMQYVRWVNDGRWQTRRMVGE